MSGSVFCWTEVINSAAICYNGLVDHRKGLLIKGSINEAY